MVARFCTSSLIGATKTAASSAYREVLKIQRIQSFYSPGNKSPNFFALAKTHNLASLLILSTITKVGASLWWKIRAFRSCQSSQTISKVREAKPFRRELGLSTIDDHQS
jgi:hypothetical protein